MTLGRATCGRGPAERLALDRHDDVLQSLAAIHWALEAGAHDHARELTAIALGQAQAIVGDLLDAGGEVDPAVPGALRREPAATARSCARSRRA